MSDLTRDEIETIAVKAGDVAGRIAHKGGGAFDGTTLFREIFAAMVNADAGPNAPSSNPAGSNAEESVS